MKKWLPAIILAIVVFACKEKGSELKTGSGYKYILYTKSTGPKVKLGDYITIEMVYKNSKDSILFDSRNANVPLRFQLDKIPFIGSLEDGLTNLAANDSATFFVPADSLYNYLYRGKGISSIAQNQTAFLEGTLIRFDVKVVKIQSYEEAELEIELKMSEKEKKERAALNKYLFDNGIKEKPDSSGYYMIIHEMGKGESVDSGKIVTVEYEGRFLDGKVFDGTKKAGHPYRFVSGAHHVILGWELAMKKLKTGSKVTLIVPSRLAYGEEGIRRPKDGTYIVPPYTSLIFDIEIVSAEDLPAVSGISPQ
ncbi:MAG: FKBP-type peptidyl-prolyl cis-trans isomerase [Bacteroidetes bacterium]|nr:FKBP-type peptidyl-prolyl cis-trans isomerase [Bacteroidota bacterium]